MGLTLWYIEPGTGRTRAVLLRGLLVVGSRPGAWGITLDDRTVIARHAEIDATNEDSPRVRTLAPRAAVFVNGVLRNAPVRLKAGDRLQVGGVVAWVEADGNLRRARPVEAPPVPISLVPVPPTTRGLQRPNLAAIALALVAFGIVVFALSVTREPGSSSPPAVLEAPRPARPLVAQKPAWKTATEIPTPRVVLQRIREEISPSFAFESVVGLTNESSNGKSLGTGFIVSGKGHLLTNYHVTGGSMNLEAICRDGSRLWAHVVASDPDKDLAVLKFEERRSFTPLSMGSSESLRETDTVFAIGFPFSEELGFTVTRGIVSGIRKISGRTFIQHDAAINPGNSGGPLLDGGGRVVGINTWKIQGADRLGFAIPIEDAMPLLRDAGT